MGGQRALAALYLSSMGVEILRQYVGMMMWVPMVVMCGMMMQTTFKE